MTQNEWDVFKSERLKDYRKSLENNYIDKEWIPYLEKLNKVPWFISRECCIGHEKEHPYLIFFVKDPGKFLNELWTLCNTEKYSNLIASCLGVIDIHLWETNPMYEIRFRGRKEADSILGIEEFVEMITNHSMS